MDLMSEDEEPHNPKYVTSALCKARIETLEAKMDGTRKAVYIAALSITTTLTAVQLIFHYMG